jgi:hypothetical protein
MPKKTYPLDPHGDNDKIAIPRWEYKALKEIARLHAELLKLVEEKLPEVRSKFNQTAGK